jgi:hypothetical protein
VIAGQWVFFHEVRLPLFFRMVQPVLLVFFAFEARRRWRMANEDASRRPRLEGFEATR